MDANMSLSSVTTWTIGQTSSMPIAHTHGERLSNPLRVWRPSQIRVMSAPAIAINNVER